MCKTMNKRLNLYFPLLHLFIQIVFFHSCNDTSCMGVFTMQACVHAKAPKFHVGDVYSLIKCFLGSFVNTLALAQAVTVNKVKRYVKVNVKRKRYVR